ncbi:unnamed protein product [Trichogramma brassicae]|uniref:Uncharacterized protein n=1 Tax=Trichogramma brassicae TaxID=86971 RepID=A0A6H5IJU9_9HYME|nr:unnamed protein product [Trichogramma brassicae]
MSRPPRLTHHELRHRVAILLSSDPSQRKSDRTAGKRRKVSSLSELWAYGDRTVVEFVRWPRGELQGGAEAARPYAEYALEHGAVAMLTQLTIEHGFDVHEFRWADGRSALHYLIDADRVNYLRNGWTIDWILNDEASNRSDRHGFTYLHGACATGKRDLAKRLIDESAEVVDVDSWKSSPLHLACQYRHEAVVKLLLDRGADPNQRLDRQGGAPLHALARLCLCECASHENFCDRRKPADEIVKMLLAEGADLELVDCHGDTPLQTAVASCDADLVHLLKAFIQTFQTRTRMTYDRYMQNLFVHIVHTFHLRQESMDYLREKRWELRRDVGESDADLIDSEHDEQFAADMAFEAGQLKRIEVKRGLSLYDLCQMDHRKGSIETRDRWSDWRCPELHELDYTRLIVKRYLANCRIRPHLESCAADIIRNDVQRPNSRGIYIRFDASVSNEILLDWCSKEDENNLSVPETPARRQEWRVWQIGWDDGKKSWDVRAVTSKQQHSTTITTTMSLGAEVDSWDDIEVSKSEDVRDFNQPQTAPSYHRGAKKSYIPQRSYRKYLTNPWIVGARCRFTGCDPNFDNSPQHSNTGQRRHRTFGAETQARRRHPRWPVSLRQRQPVERLRQRDQQQQQHNNGGGEAVLRRVRQAEDTPYDFLDSATMIFGVNNSILSVSSNDDSAAAAEVLFQDPRFQPQSVAVDRLTGKVYALDKRAGTLLVVDVASRNFTILMSDLLAPHEIVLDPAQGEMFILQLATSIVRANMDGSERRNIVSYMNISALAIDRGRQRLYWINDDRQIQSADYHGNDRATLFTDHTRIASLAVHGDRLYWLWPASAGASSNNSTLWRCRLSANDTSACSEHTVQPTPGLTNVTSIRSFSSPPSTTSTSNHPCSVQNGGCQQLCLLSSRRRAGRSCGCYLGHRQKPQDSRGCEPADVFLLYVANSYARAQLAEESFGWSGVDLILPTKLSLRPLQHKSVLDFEYDWINDALYFSDDSSIYATSLRGWSEQRTLLTVAAGYYYEDMAYDWVSGNVYYTEASLSPGNKHRLMMFSERNPRDFRRTVASFNYYGEFGVKGAPYSTLMDSIRGVLYFSAADTSGRDRVRNIYELAENGTRLDGRLTAKYVHEHRILALDQSAGRIYWIWEAERNRATLKWTETREPGLVTRRLDVDVDEPLRSVGVQGDWLYLGTARKISRVNKDTAEDAERLVPRYVERAGLIISGGPTRDRARTSTVFAKCANIK